MRPGPNQFAVGEKLYFFESPKANERRCLVFAHGGHLWRDAADFTLPEDIKLSFNQKTDGKALKTNPRTAMFYEPRIDNIETFEGPTRVKDYSLGKAVGRHWEADTTITYQEISATLAGAVKAGQHWTPHIVTVRRRFRFMGALITLSKVVTEITKFAEARDVKIKHFYIAACRGDHSKQRLKSTLARI